MMNKQRAGIPFGPDIPNATRFNGESVVLTLTDQIRQIIDYLAIWFYGDHIRLITVILQFVVKAIFLRVSRTENCETSRFDSTMTMFGALP
jgi:hypothetical protein